MEEIDLNDSFLANLLDSIETHEQETTKTKAKRSAEAVEEDDFHDVITIKRMKKENSEYVKNKKNVNTVRKNESSYNRFVCFLRETKESRNPEEMTMELFDQYLGR